MKPKSEKTRKRYSGALQKKAKFLFETEGFNFSRICKEIGITHRNIVYRWSKKEGWQKGRNSELVEATALSARIKKAKEVGIDEVEQMLKAKEMMSATRSQQEITMVKKNGNSVPITRTVLKPDYKIQSEGLKRAMDLTGTKIVQTKVEHKGRQDLVHRYELPIKKELS
ncbi:hypothetical protein ACFL5V_05755 [Fibrobacterota bacterium]